jgi:hypothetical protein
MKDHSPWPKPLAIIWDTRLLFQDLHAAENQDAGMNSRVEANLNELTRLHYVSTAESNVWHPILKYRREKTPANKQAAQTVR